MANIVESYKNRLAISESVHQKSHNGAKMSAAKKLMVAAVLDNTSRFLSEAFDNSSATQRADIGDFKKFCLNISTIALPNLILPEIMLVQPMSSLSGYVTYLRYTAGTDKGGVTEGRLFNDPYSLGKMDPDRMRYTSAAVSEKYIIKHSDTVQPGTETPVEYTTFSLDWYPVVSVKSIEMLDAEGNVISNWPVTTVKPGEPIAPADGTAIVTTEGKVTLGKVGGAIVGEGNTFKIKYFYDNEIIPQEVQPTSLPTLKAHMQGINLHAHARRIAVYYSQLSAFQAKNDYGMDLGQQLAAQAQGELAYK